MSPAAAVPDDEPVSILLVDDRPSNLQSLRATLDRPDYRLVLARSGPEALATVLREEIALILLDVAMPQMDGFEVAKIIKQRDRSRQIPIIFVTASVHDMAHVFRGYTVGAVDYLRKPLDPHAVRSKVAVFVELFRQRRRIERQASQLRAAELREQQRLREQAEHALKISEAIYELTFEHAPVGIGHADPQGRWTRVNGRLCTLLGRPHCHLVGSDLVAVVTPSERAALAGALDALRQGEVQLYDQEHCLVGPGTRRAWVRMTVSSLRDEQGAATQQMVVVNDITERKAIEVERGRLVRQLEEGIRARDDFISIAAHELKTPITPLRLQVGWLMHQLALDGEVTLPPDRLNRGLQRIDRASKRLETLVSSLLDVSRLSVGKVRLDRASVDLGALLAEVVGRLSDDAERAGSRIELSRSAEAVGSWDQARLEQVATNLVSNAIKYGSGQPIDVEVGLDPENGARAWFRVRDRGIGISGDAQKRVFDRFERAAPVEHYGGFGLGLWISREIVEAHGGSIELQSTPGQGSAFTVRLPLEPPVDPLTAALSTVEQERADAVSS
jgi:PAS domain S-box-containing protein